jgi:hypothetical protein
MSLPTSLKHYNWFLAHGTSVLQITSVVSYPPCDHCLHISRNQRISSALLRSKRAPTRPWPPPRHSSPNTSSRLIASAHISTRYRTSSRRRIADCLCQIPIRAFGMQSGLLTVRDTDGSATAGLGSTFHRHPCRVGPPELAVPNVSSCTCHRHASQSAARGAESAGTNANRSVHHNG